MTDKQTDWFVILLATGAGVVAALQVGKVPPALTMVQSDLTLGLVVAGFVASLFNMIAAVFAVPVGFLSDRVNERRLVIFGLMFLIAGGLAGAGARADWWILTARLLEGAGFLLVAVAAPAIVVGGASPKTQRFALGVWSAYLPTGMAAMMLLAPLIMAGFGWRGLWLANVAILIGYLFLFSWGTRNFHLAPRQPRTWAEVKATLRRPGPWLLAASFACYTIQFYGLMVWLPTVLTEALGYAAGTAAVIAGIVVATNIIGTLAGGRLLQRGIPRWILLVVVSGSLGLLSLAFYGDAVPPPAKLVAAFAFSTIGGILPASVLAGAPMHSPALNQVGVTNGAIVQGSNIGSVIGPPLIAAFVTQFGTWNQAGWLLLASGIVGIGVALALGAIERRL